MPDHNQSVFSDSTIRIQDLNTLGLRQEKFTSRLMQDGSQIRPALKMPAVNTTDRHGMMTSINGGAKTLLV